MKFVIAVVIVALAACAQASDAYAPLAYAYAPAPLIARPVGSFADQRQFVATRVVSPLAYSAPLGYPYAGAYYGNPLAYAAPAPIAYAAPAPIAYAQTVVAAPLEPTYTAANRGAVHVAPLPGHSESTSAINLEAAPGTL